MRITVFIHHLFEQEPLLFQKFDHTFVRFFDKRTGKIRYGRLETAALVHHVDHGKPILLSDAIVVFTERGSNMHDTRAVRQRYIAVADNIVRFFAERSLCIVKQRFVFRKFVFLALFHGQDFVIFKKRPDQCLRQHIMRPVFRFDLRIIFIRVHAKRHVGRERPGRRRPRKKITVFQTFPVKTNENGSLFDVFIPLRHFMRGKRRSAARAIRHDLMTFVQKPFFPDLFQSPPDRFDVFVIVSNVRVFHVSPVSDPFRHLFPFALIFPYALFAFLDKRFNAVFFYILLTVHSQKFFHFQLDRESVRIPPRFAQDMFALHRLVTGNDILHDTRKDVPDMRLAVRRRRSVVKREFLAAFVLFHTVFKHMLFFPERDHVLFTVDKIHRRVNLGIQLFILIHCFLSLR